MQTNVSLAVIVKNSADVLDVFFRWATDNFREINVVVDTDNDDLTLDKCLHWDSKYESIHLKQHKFDDFSSQNNRAIDMSSLDYCLHIDADEILESMPDDMLEMHMIKSKSDVGSFNRLNLQCDYAHYNVDTRPDTQLRLIRMASNLRMNGKLVDESIELKCDTIVSHIPIDIIHFGHVRTNAALLLKGRDRLVFASDDSCDGQSLMLYGEDWFIERNKKWNVASNLKKLQKTTIEQIERYTNARLYFD